MNHGTAEAFIERAEIGRLRIVLGSGNARVTLEAPEADLFILAANIMSACYSDGASMQYTLCGACSSVIERDA